VSWTGRRTPCATRSARTRRSVRLGAERPGELLQWDSEFWGLEIGRVADGEVTEAGLARVDEWAAAERLDCLYLLASADDPPSVHAAERAGFRVMDLRIELRRVAAVEEADGVREAREDDRDALRGIARSSHRITRFYADPNFPDARCDDLYDTWIARSLEGWADGVLVVEADGSPAGYVSCHLDRQEGTGSIGLIAVDEAARGQGLGLTLTLGAVAWCGRRGMNEMSVVTQGRNVAALRTFEQAGFRVSSVAVWLHKWYGR
jgi:RimJ/RimL family protein N-acetyltransferase